MRQRRFLRYLDGTTVGIYPLRVGRLYKPTDVDKFFGILRRSICNERHQTHDMRFNTNSRVERRSGRHNPAKAEGKHEVLFAQLFGNRDDKDGGV